MRRLLTGLLGAWLLVSACGDDDDGDRAAVTSIPEDTTSTSTTTTTPETVPPDVIPQDEALITEEYVEQVLNELYEVSLEATILTREAGFVEEPTIRIVEATSTPESARNRLNSLAADAASDFADYRAELAPVTAEVVEVIEATRTCIFAEVEFDSSGLVATPGNTEGFRIFARLQAANEEQRDSGFNPTAWVLDGLPATDDDDLPEQRCGDI